MVLMICGCAALAVPFVSTHVINACILHLMTAKHRLTWNPILYKLMNACHEVLLLPVRKCFKQTMHFFELSAFMAGVNGTNMDLTCLDGVSILFPA